MAKGAFAFHVARAMLAGGFPPDVISSDVHVLCVDGPAFDNLETMSKFLCLGMPVPDIVRAVTATPAGLLGLPELGSLAPGTTGDATVLRIADGPCVFTDVVGETMAGTRRFALDSVVVGGALWHSAGET